MSFRCKVDAKYKVVATSFKEPPSIIKKDYHIEHKIKQDWDLAEEEDNDDKDAPTVQVTIKDKHLKEVGHAYFVIFDDDKTIVGKGIEVDDKHRRRGLASWMYWYAEKITGYKYVSGDSRTELGDKFLSSYGY